MDDAKWEMGDEIRVRELLSSHIHSDEMPSKIQRQWRMRTNQDNA